MGRYSANPPTTRVVIDLNSPQHYQIFPDGKTVIVKLASDQQQAAARSRLNNVSYTPPAPAKPAFTMNVEFKDGRLSIVADKASLAQVLGEVQRQTGTDIPIPPGAAQEQIVTSIGPLPLREALMSLLNGSRFNFIMVDSDREPGRLKSVILTYRGAGGMSQPGVATPEPPVAENPQEPEQPAQPEPQPEAQQPSPRKAPASKKPRNPRTPPYRSRRNAGMVGSKCRRERPRSCSSDETVSRRGLPQITLEVVNVGASVLARAAANQQPALKGLPQITPRSCKCRRERPRSCSSESGVSPDGPSANHAPKFY